MIKSKIDNFIVDKFIQNNTQYNIDINKFNTEIYSLFQDIKIFGPELVNGDFALHTELLTEKLKNLNKLRNEKKNFELQFRRQCLTKIEKIAPISEEREMVEIFNVIVELEKYFYNKEEAI